jgi:hypothetical protein
MRKSRTAGLVLVLVWLAGSAGSAVAQQPGSDLIEQVGGGEINWTTGWIKAKGIGVPPANAMGDRGRTLAERAGFVVALRNLLEVVSGVRVDAEATADRYLGKSEVIRTRVSGYIRGAQIVTSVEQPDKSVEVTVRMPLWGFDSLTTAMLMDKPAAGQAGLPDTGDEQAYTGLVIDARGLGVKPACFPLVLDQDGKPLYGPQTVIRGAVEQDGMVEYKVFSAKANLSSLVEGRAVVAAHEAGKTGPREGKRPLKIKGLAKAGTLQANIMVSAEDARKLREDRRVGRALRGGKVVIVTDPLIGGMEGKGPGDRQLSVSRLDAVLR